MKANIMIDMLHHSTLFLKEACITLRICDYGSFIMLAGN